MLCRAEPFCGLIMEAVALPLCTGHVHRRPVRGILLQLEADPCYHELPAPDDDRGWLHAGVCMSVFCGGADGLLFGVALSVGLCVCVSVCLCARVCVSVCVSVVRACVCAGGGVVVVVLQGAP
jgi:hypothetical protein